MVAVWHPCPCLREPVLARVHCRVYCCWRYACSQVQTASCQAPAHGCFAQAMRDPCALKGIGTELPGFDLGTFLMKGCFSGVR